MSRNLWRDLLPTTEQLDGMNPEALGQAALAADCNLSTITFGITAIGGLLAGAANNEDHGIAADHLASLGWILQSMGELSTALMDTHEGARQRAKQRG